MNLADTVESLVAVGHTKMFIANCLHYVHTFVIIARPMIFHILCQILVGIESLV